MLPRWDAKDYADILFFLFLDETCSHSRPADTVLMRGHSICFLLRQSEIILKYLYLLFYSWSTVIIHCNNPSVKKSFVSFENTRKILLKIKTNFSLILGLRSYRSDPNDVNCYLSKSDYIVNCLSKICN